jgi:hypothetical protein
MSGLASPAGTIWLISWCHCGQEIRKELVADSSGEKRKRWCHVPDGDPECQPKPARQTVAA